MLSRLQDMHGNDVNNFLLEVQAGNIPGAQIIERSGKNPDISSTTADVWESGGIFTPLVADTTLYMWSSNVADTATIAVTGVNQNYESVLVGGSPIAATLQGSTPVALGLQMYFVCQMENISSTPLQGTVYLSRVSGSAALTDLVAIITPPHEISLLGRCVIPTGYTGYLVMGEAGASISSVVNTPNAVISFYAKVFGGVYRLADEVDANVNVMRPYSVLPEKTEVKTIATTFDAGTAVRTKFWILLLDNTVWIR